MKRPRAGCPGGALAAIGDVAPRIDPQAVRRPRPQLDGVADVSAFDFDHAAIWSRRARLCPPLMPAQAGIRICRRGTASALPRAAERRQSAPLPAPLAPPPTPADLELDRRRDDLLTAFGKATLNDRYLLAGESSQDMFARVSCAYRRRHRARAAALRCMSRLWFMPATPMLSNGGTDARPADLLLPQRGAGFARRHRRHLERERVAGLERRRHRHLLGRRALDRREGERLRPDLGHHSVRPRDGRR